MNGWDELLIGLLVLIIVFGISVVLAVWNGARITVTYEAKQQSKNFVQELKEHVNRTGSAEEGKR